MISSESHILKWPSLKASTLPLLHTERHVSPKDQVPWHKERLRIVILASFETVVYIMVSHVIPKTQPKRIPWQIKRWMHVYRLNTCKRIEEYACPWRHAGDQEGQTTTNSIQNESLQGMVVESTPCIWHNQCMMPWMYVLIHELVYV